MSQEWDEKRDGNTGLRDERWPEGVYSLSLGNLGLLGIHHETQKLYWDGKEIVTRSVVRLGSKELWLAAMASFSTLGMLVLAIGETFGWWG